MATYVVGDIQGCYEELQRLLEKIRFDPAADRLLCSGDLVNRGGQFVAVIHDKWPIPRHRLVDRLTSQQQETPWPTVSGGIDHKPVTITEYGHMRSLYRRFVVTEFDTAIEDVGRHIETWHDLDLRAGSRPYAPVL